MAGITPVSIMRKRTKSRPPAGIAAITKTCSILLPSHSGRPGVGRPRAGMNASCALFPAAPLSLHPSSGRHAGDPLEGPAKREGVRKPEFKADRLHACPGLSEHPLGQRNSLREDEPPERDARLRVE